MNSFIKCGLVFVAGCVVGTLSERNRDKIDPLVKSLRDRAKDILAKRKSDEKSAVDLHSATLAHTDPTGVGEPTDDDKVRHEKFSKLYENLYGNVPSLPFDLKWNNGTGYLNGLTEDRDTVPQGFSTSIDAITHRRMVIHRNDHNIVVVFERYRQGAGGIVVANGQLPKPEHSDILNSLALFYEQEFNKK